MDLTTLIKGCDISQIQGNIDFHALKAAGFSFIIARAYVGNNGLDSMYHTYIQLAQQAELEVASYNFVFPLPTNGNTTRDPKVQANLHYQATKGTLTCIDLEWPVQADFAKWNTNATLIKEWLTDYLEEYTRLDGGRKPIIYTYPNYAQVLNLDSYFSQYPLWIASYADTPDIPAPWTDFTIWQQSGGTESFNNVKIDIDYVKDLSLWQTSINQEIPVLNTTTTNITNNNNSLNNNIFSNIFNYFTKLFK